MSEEYSIADSKQTDFGFQVDAQENPGGTPEARSCLCICLALFLKPLPRAGFLTLAPGTNSWATGFRGASKAGANLLVRNLGPGMVACRSWCPRAGGRLKCVGTGSRASAGPP